MATNNTIKLYDLVLKSGVTLSPFVWRTKLALRHKGFDIEDIGVSYMGIKSIADGQQRRLPVIEDDGKIIPDSWKIAEYLDATYPERPTICRTPSELNFVKFLDGWMFANIIHPWFSCYTYDQVKLVHPEDVDYVQTAHTRIFRGRDPKDVVADRSERLPKVRPLLDPIRTLLKDTKWFGGEEPNQVDFMMLGHFLWCASLASEPPLTKDDSLFDYIDRGFDRWPEICRDERLYPLA